MTRWVDGSSWVWTAFRNDVGTGEGSSALEFDQLLPPNGAAPFAAPPTPPAPTPPTLTAPTPAQSTLNIGGATVGYTASITNSGPALAAVTLQGWIRQGTTRRAAGGQLVVCGTSPAGVLPIGTSPVSGSLSPSNSAGGAGTLVTGAATAELELARGRCRDSRAADDSERSAPVREDAPGDAQLAARFTCRNHYFSQLRE